MTLPAMEDACKDCLRARHVCQAMVLVNGDPVCLACADGEQCPHTGAWRPVKSYLIRGQEVRMTDGVVMGPEFVDPWACRPGERAQGRTVITPEVRRAIAEADPRRPHVELALEYGVSDNTVINIRKKAGVFVPLTGRGGSKGRIWRKKL
jgi:hypothetical protein